MSFQRYRRSKGNISTVVSGWEHWYRGDERRVGVALKIFAFDRVFYPDKSQEAVSVSAVSDVIDRDISGHNDGCVFRFGHSSLDQRWTPGPWWELIPTFLVSYRAGGKSHQISIH